MSQKRKILRLNDPVYVAAMRKHLRASALSIVGADNLGYQPNFSIKVSLDPELQAERDACADPVSGFFAFLPHWKFINRETGRISSFAELWPGQEQAAREMVAAMHDKERPFLFLLKAGKLGFTELECAFDAWRAIYGRPNARVHLLSKGLPEAVTLLGMVKFGIEHLPAHISRRVMGEIAGGQTLRQLTLEGDSPDDRRLIVSYAATGTTAIDQNAAHTHLDELSHVQDQEGLWGSVSTTVAEGDTLHIVTRGAGEVYTKKLWEMAISGLGKLRGFFARYDTRPGRDGAWRAREAGTMHVTALKHFAPETPADALAGDQQTEFVPIEMFDACQVDRADVPPLLGKEMPAVIGIDAGVRSDWFAISLVTRHPDKVNHKGEVVHRFTKSFDPSRGFVDFDEIYDYIVKLTQQYRIIEAAYDPYQMEAFAQRLNKHRVVVAFEFNQGPERLIADTNLHHAIVTKEFHHEGDPGLRMAVQNASVETVEKNGTESKLRIVKSSNTAKVDTLVATSMAAERCLYLNM